jgi:hypothetical protein
VRGLAIVWGKGGHLGDIHSGQQRVARWWSGSGNGELWRQRLELVGGIWSVKEGKWRWETRAVDEGEHNDAFYRVQEGGEPVLGKRRRWPVVGGLKGINYGERKRGRC